MLIRLLWVEKATYTYLPKPVVRMRYGGASTSGLDRNWLLNKEIVKACKETGKKYMMMETVVYAREYLYMKQLRDAGELGKLKVVTRRGDTTNPDDLKRANLSSAKSIIILDSDEAGDANVVSTTVVSKHSNRTSNRFSGRLSTAAKNRSFQPQQEPDVSMKK